MIGIGDIQWQRWQSFEHILRPLSAKSRPCAYAEGAAVEICRALESILVRSGLDESWAPNRDLGLTLFVIETFPHPPLPGVLAGLIARCLPRRPALS